LDSSTVFVSNVLLSPAMKRGRPCVRRHEPPSRSANPRLRHVIFQNSWESKHWLGLEGKGGSEWQAFPRAWVRMERGSRPGIQAALLAVLKPGNVPFYFLLVTAYVPTM